MSPQPRRVLCAPNAFKGSLSAANAAAALSAGVARAGGTATLLPVADGGDGTLDVLLSAAGGDATTTLHGVTGPLGESVQARLGWLGSGTAVVELAEAAGLRLVNPASHDALRATSRGVGELMMAAVDAGAERVIVGVGGSACTDGGAGLLHALGVRLLDGDGGVLAPGGAGLQQLATIDVAALDVRLRDVSVEVAVDVRNPLLGPDGAAAVFGPQKGASHADVQLLDAALARLVQIAERDVAGATGLADSPGSGAAGGCGYALALIGATLLPGAALVCNQLRIDEHIEKARLVITGEGRLDAQTAFGKAPAEVGERAKRLGVPCAAIAGSVADPLGGLFTRVLSLADVVQSGEDTYADASALLTRAGERLVSELLA